MKKQKMEAPDALGPRYANLMLPDTVYEGPDGEVVVALVFTEPLSPAPKRVHIMIPVENIAAIARDMKAAKRTGLARLARRAADAASSSLPSDVEKKADNIFRSLEQALMEPGNVGRERYAVELLVDDSHGKQVAVAAGLQLRMRVESLLPAYDVASNVSRKSRFWVATVGAVRPGIV